MDQVRLNNVVNPRHIILMFIEGFECMLGQVCKASKKESTIKKLQHVFLSCCKEMQWVTLKELSSP